MERLISFGGVFVMLFIAWLFSNNKRKMDMRVIGGGLALQAVLALIVLRTEVGAAFFALANGACERFISLSDEGARFVFGDKFQEHFFAMKVLPTIIFVSALSSVLFHLGIMQRVVGLMSRVMMRVMRVSGAESLVTAADVFVGQTESPLLIRPYLATMTRSEIFCMMIGGMATVAGGVMAAYVSMGISAGHLLSASLMSAPGALVIGKIMFPETEQSPTMGKNSVTVTSDAENILDAACRGASDGLLLALNVGAMLIAFIALMAVVNGLLKWAGEPFGVVLTAQQILGYGFQPLAFAMGIPWSEGATVGALLGEKTILNEFVAYIHLSEQAKAGALSPRSVSIATYALCGFANFASIAIQIGGIGSLLPSRKHEFAQMGLRAMIGGTLACFLNASIAGILL